MAGVRKDLSGDERSSAQLTSVVEKFRSLAGARAELNYWHAQVRLAGQMTGETYTMPFRVSGIPSAAGYDTAIRGSLGHTVAFIDGRFYYQRTATAPPTEHGAPSRAQVISAATSLYNRIDSPG